MMLLLMLIGIFPVLCHAQSGLRIASIFEKYGKLKGATMVVLSADMLETYSMDQYKSITIKNAAPYLSEIRQCLEVDKKGARKIKEIVDAGQLLSGYYQLPQKKEDVNRFILFKTAKKGSATLIYIEGELESDDLVTMLFMKKD